MVKHTDIHIFYLHEVYLSLSMRRECGDIKYTVKECIKNWVMDKYFWANFISFVMSGTLNEERYKDLNSLDSLIKRRCLIVVSFQ